MTHRAAGSGRGIPRIWLLPAATLVVGLGAAALGILSRSLALDFVAWWPVWLVVVVLAVIARGRRIGKVRVSGLVPLVAFVALVALVVGHLQGWPIMPSATARLVGPPAEGASQAVLEAHIDGVIRLSSGSSFLYEVEPIRRGGEIGLPEGVEQQQPGSGPEDLQPSLIVVSLELQPDPGLYGFAGWDIRLSEAPEWVISLTGRIEADLTGLLVDSFNAWGDGVIVLGAPVTEGPQILLMGEFRLVAPRGVPVRIEGEAEVPQGWERFGDGWRSPTAGVGWNVIVSEASSVTVVEG
jgi:hypothetical protein